MTIHSFWFNFRKNLIDCMNKLNKNLKFDQYRAPRQILSPDMMMSIIVNFLQERRNIILDQLCHPNQNQLLRHDRELNSYLDLNQGTLYFISSKHDGRY